MKDYINIPIAQFRGKLPSLSLRDCWLAGGCVRDAFAGEPLRDVDIFGPSIESLEKLKDDLISEGKATLKKDNALLTCLDVPHIGTVQLVKRSYSDLAECLDSFDFAHCQFGYDGTTAWASLDAVISVLRKTIQIKTIHREYSADSILRLQKYIQRGYLICARQAGELLRAIATLNLTNLDIDEQIHFYSDGTVRAARFD